MCWKMSLFISIGVVIENVFLYYLFDVGILILNILFNSLPSYFILFVYCFIVLCLFITLSCYSVWLINV